MAENTSYTTGDLAKAVNGRLNGPDSISIKGINALREAGPDQIAFIADTIHARQWGESKAGAALISEGLDADDHDPASRALIVVQNAEIASIELLKRFQPPELRPDPGVHRTAWLHESVKLGRGVRIGPHVCVDRDCVIGDGVTLHAGARLYAKVTVGDGAMIHAGCVIRERCRVGHNVILNPGVVIGADGFGYRPAPDGSGLLKIPHLGGVIVEDDVEIGANTCVDRGKFGDTVIGAGTKIDNLVQIAHNCRIGRSCVIAGLAGLAGSVTVGDGVQIGAQAGLTEHLTVGDGARIGAQAGVMRDVPAGASVVGSPAVDAREAFRQVAALRKLASRGDEH